MFRGSACLMIAKLERYKLEKLEWLANGKLHTFLKICILFETHGGLCDIHLKLIEI